MFKFVMVQMRANTHVSSSVTDIVDILDVNYDDLFCDYNTLTAVNSVTNTRTIQQTPMFHGNLINFIIITLIYYITKQRVCETISIIKMLTISKNLVWPHDLESFKGGNFNTLSLNIT
jgi:ABC-type proline/glycine betaine transport system permease subunit